MASRILPIRAFWPESSAWAPMPASALSKAAEESR